MTELLFAVRTEQGVEAAARAVEAALAQRKFSVLWELDVNAKLEEKGQHLDRPYRILEVCSAPRAREALEAEPNVGYFLPCKVVIYEKDGHTEIGLPRPTALIGMVGTPELGALAAEVETVLVDAVREAAGPEGVR